jgi:hypothetical protein
MKQSIHVIEIGILLIAVAIAGNAWIGARNDAAKLKTTLTAEHAVIEQAAVREVDRDKALASAVATIKAQMRSVRTPQQAAKAIPALLSELPLPISTPQPDVSAEPPGTEPDHTPLTIPTDDIKPLYDHLKNCQICTAERDIAKQDLADQETRNAALAKERDAAIIASKGGSFWRRLKSKSEWLSIGIAVGITIASGIHARQ